MCVCILFASITMSSFDYVHQEYWPVVFFLIISLAAFGIRAIGFNEGISGPPVFDF